MEPHIVTVEEFENIPDPTDGSRLELIDGVVVKFPTTTARKGILCSKLIGILSEVVDESEGWLTCNNAGVILGRNPDTVIGPDLGFWSKTKQPNIPKGYFEHPPELAIEVMTVFDRRTTVRNKIVKYIQAGTPLAWLIDPDARTVTVYSGSMKGLELGEAETLDGGTVLPGFTCKIADLLK